MMDIKITNGKLYVHNMLLIEEENDTALMNRLYSITEGDVNSYQKKVVISAINQIKVIKNIRKGAWICTLILI